MGKFGNYPGRAVGVGAEYVCAYFGKRRAAVGAHGGFLHLGAAFHVLHRTQNFGYNLVGAAD